MPLLRLLLALTLAAVAAGPGGGLWANAIDAPKSPTLVLTRANALSLRGGVDSNSPAIWEFEGGRQMLHVMTSLERPFLSTGASLQTLGPARPSTLAPWPDGATWMEGVVRDGRGTWYGYYHNERSAAAVCRGTELKIPRIGAARSGDHGVTWEDLGIILEAPRGMEVCATTNEYFVGGVGDFSVQLEEASGVLYIFFSMYQRDISRQGVGVARLSWADRDRPAGKVAVWGEGAWLSARQSMLVPDGLRWLYPPATPLFPVTKSWHAADRVADALWGPSLHWNTHLRQYVMLLSRTKSTDFSQEGIYAAFAPRLDEPRLWSPPQRILSGGSWYPQVMGTEPGVGTDKRAGRTARFFMMGESRWTVTFSP